MSEQKYYVKIRNIVDSNQLDNWLINGAGTMHKIGTVRPSFSTNLGLPKISFTKSELSKIMDGALYSVSDEKCNYCLHSGDTCGDERCEEWINPLIELVPVEEE